MGVKTRKLGNINNQIVEWQSVHVSDGSTALTTVAGRGYFIDTTSAAQTVNLHGSPKFGDRVSLKDFARTWHTNAVTLGSTTFDGATNTPSFSTRGQTVSLIYMGGSKGWSLVNDDNTTSLGAEFVTATGGTVTTSGDFKIHTFTGDSNFVVSNAGNTAGSNKIEYLVSAGGGGAAGGGPGSVGTGGGGAGGVRFASTSIAPLSYPAKPLAGTEITAAAQTYPVTVGAGGAGSPNANNTTKGSSGNNSVFSTITSTAGGGGAADNNQAGLDGGSGGGGSNGGAVGAGNTPPTSPSQGNNGGPGVGTATPGWGGGAGGGMTAAGQAAQGSNGGNGGEGGGFPTAFGANGQSCGSFRYYGGGGGAGAGYNGRSDTAGTGGKGGGGAGKNGAAGPTTGNAGTANTGGGGGGVATNSTGGAGGKGIVIIRYKFQ